MNKFFRGLIGGAILGAFLIAPTYTHIGLSGDVAALLWLLTAIVFACGYAIERK